MPKRHSIEMKLPIEVGTFIYDEMAGLPEEGIAPGTPWHDVPETWSCPDCSATKADFEMASFSEHSDHFI